MIKGYYAQLSLSQSGGARGRLLRTEKESNILITSRFISSCFPCLLGMEMERFQKVYLTVQFRENLKLFS